MYFHNSNYKFETSHLQVPTISKTKNSPLVKYIIRETSEKIEEKKSKGKMF